MPTQRDVIRFDTEPVKVKLDKGPYAGIECHGQYGIDWRYSVNHGKAVMYLPEEARDALVQTGVAAGEEVAIRRLGKRRWEVERIDPDLPFPDAETAQSKAAAEAATPGASNSNTRSAPQRQFAPPERAEMSAPPAEPDPFVLAASAVTASRHLMSCYCVAVEVAVEVQEYARRKGMQIAFTGSDIRAMGITVYIGENQRLREAS